MWSSHVELLPWLCWTSTAPCWLVVIVVIVGNLHPAFISHRVPNQTFFFFPSSYLRREPLASTGIFWCGELFSVRTRYGYSFHSYRTVRVRACDTGSSSQCWTRFWLFFFSSPPFTKTSFRFLFHVRFSRSFLFLIFNFLVTLERLPLFYPLVLVCRLPKLSPPRTREYLLRSVPPRRGACPRFRPGPSMLICMRHPFGDRWSSSF